MRALSRLLLCGSLLAAFAASAAPLDFAGQSGSELHYRVTHKFHQVDATAKDPQARARVLDDGGVQVMVRANVASFDSGNGNRDAHMQEVVDAARFPSVEVKAVGTGLKLPSRFPATVALPVKGQVTLHGVTQPFETTVQLTFADARHVTAEVHFNSSLEGFHIERPALAFVKVDDPLQLSAHLVFAGAQ